MINSVDRRDENIATSAEPEINRYQSFKKIPLILKLLAGGVFFILLGLVFFKVQGFYKEVKRIENTDNRSPERASASTKQRRDLGQFIPRVDPVPAPPLNAATVTELPPPTLPERKLYFKKYLSIPVQDKSLTSGAAGAGRSEGDATLTPPATVEGGGSPEIKVEAITMDPNLFIEANTYIPCTLQTRFVSDIAGIITCVISRDVYSANSHTKLIEKGTKAFGSYRTGTLKHGQGRMFVIWTQLRTPDFKKISLVNTQVVGQLGEAGIEGWIDTHFLERFGNALMLSIVQDVVAAAAKTTVETDRRSDYTANSRDSLAKMANTALENSINIPPTLYKNQGDVLGILVGEDIDFSGIYSLRLKR